MHDSINSQDSISRIRRIKEIFEDKSLPVILIRAVTSIAVDVWDNKERDWVKIIGPKEQDLNQYVVTESEVQKLLVEIPINLCRIATTGEFVDAYARSYYRLDIGEELLPRPFMARYRPTPAENETWSTVLVDGDGTYISGLGINAYTLTEAAKAAAETELPVEVSSLGIKVSIQKN